LVLNSGFGELESTGGFLQALSETGLARPLLFQNSLHNSTTGFLAIQLGILGPVLTINHREEGGFQAFEAASVLIQSGQCQSCLVVTVETVPKEFDQGQGVGLEGASVILLSTAEFAKAQGLDGVALEALPMKQLREIVTTQSSRALQSVLSDDFVHRLAEYLA
jgi:hypothetical protein